MDYRTSRLGSKVYNPLMNPFGECLRTIARWTTEKQIIHNCNKNERYCCNNQQLKTDTTVKNVSGLLVNILVTDLLSQPPHRNRVQWLLRTFSTKMWSKHQPGEMPVLSCPTRSDLNSPRLRVWRTGIIKWWKLAKNLVLVLKVDFLCWRLTFYVSLIVTREQ